MNKFSSCTEAAASAELQMRSVNFFKTILSGYDHRTENNLPFLVADLATCYFEINTFSLLYYYSLTICIFH